MEQKERINPYLDELSGVKNRKYLSLVKSRIIPEIRKKSGVFTVAITDLDHFKEINDTYGHLKGDEAIRNFATFLSENLRKDDVIVRYGGDEFIVIQPGLSGSEAYIVWERLINRLREREYDGIKLGASAGIASYPEDGITFDELFRRADGRLYNAKRSGRGRVGVEDTEKRITIPSVKLIDRTEEKDALLENIRDGSVTLIRGEAGIGKTRLMKEVLGNIKDIDVLWSDCLALDRKIAYYVIRELVKYRIRRGGDVILKDMPESLKVEIAKIVPGVLDESKGKYIDEMIDRYRLYEAVRYVIEHGERLKLVVVDNMQWVDEDSVEVFNYIIRVDREKKVRFIFATRVEEESEVAENFFAGLTRERSVKVIKLSPMKPVYMKELVRVILNDDVPELEEYVAKKSSGNPFYAEELIQSLHTDGFLEVKNNRWNFNPPLKDILPRGVEDVVKRRMSQLSEEAQEIVKVLSVAVKGYIDLLVEITGFNESHVFGLIEDALKAGLIKENEEGEYVEFRSELIRSVVYQKEVSKLKKKMLHRKVAEWVERNMPEGMEEDLAYHYYVQGNAEKVVKYGILAGDRLRRMYANRDALRYYTWALEMIEKLEGEEYRREHVQLLLKIAEIHRVLGNYPLAKEQYEKAVEMARASNFPDLLASSYNGLAWTYQILGMVDEARKKVEEALSIATEHDLIAEKVAAYNTLGIIYRDTDKKENALNMYSKALDLAEKVDNPKNRATILNNMAIYMHENGKFKEALDYYEKAEKIARENDLPKEMAMITYNKALVYIDLGENELVEEHLKNAIEISKKIGYRRIEASAMWAYGYFMQEQGRFEEAKNYLENALYAFYTIQDIRMIGVTYSTLGTVEKALGFYERSLLSHGKALEAFTKSNNLINAAVEHIAMGTIHLVRAEFDTAFEHFNAALHMAEKAGSAVYTVRSLLSLAEYSIYQDECKNAEDYVKRAQQLLNEAEGERWRVKAMEYDVADCMGERDNLYEIAKAMKGLLPEETIRYDRFVQDTYMIDAAIVSSRGDEAKNLLGRMEEALLKYPHRELMADLKYLKWKYSKKFNQPDEGRLFNEAISEYEALGLRAKVKKVKEERELKF